MRHLGDGVPNRPGAILGWLLLGSVAVWWEDFVGEFA